VEAGHESVWRSILYGAVVEILEFIHFARVLRFAICDKDPVRVTAESPTSALKLNYKDPS
jgi:hypothetical protein